MKGVTAGRNVPAIAADRATRLVHALQGKRRLLVLTHANPDPDSLASASGLRLLARQKVGLDSEFGLCGRIMRAENKEMVRALGLELTPIEDLDLDTFDCIALVDTQPGFGHTPLPDGRQIDIVVDHHVPPVELPSVPPAAFHDVRTEIGATSTMVTGYLMDLGVQPSVEVATALFYGIKTDTADLARNVSPADEAAYNFLVPHVDRARLASIVNPPLTLEYYRALRTALTNIRIFGEVVLCSLGRVENPEMVAEVADLLLRMEHAKFVYCGGLVERSFHVSVRCEPGERDAWFLIRDALRGEGSFGGHGTVAGGFIPVPNGEARTLRRLERRLEKNILRAHGIEGMTVTGLG
jgi:nanoRNase/pAp phosphatase (c-di-AMP/oligoRNAs hydrolase)